MDEQLQEAVVAATESVEGLRTLTARMRQAPRALRMAVAGALMAATLRQVEKAPLIARPHFGRGSGNHNGRTTTDTRPSWTEHIRAGVTIDEVTGRLDQAMRIAIDEKVPRGTRGRWLAAARARVDDLIRNDPEQAHEAALRVEESRR